MDRQYQLKHINMFLLGVAEIPDQWWRKRLGISGESAYRCLGSPVGASGAAIRLDGEER
jgi:hypothetical protein